MKKVKFCSEGMESFLGNFDENLKFIEKVFGVSLSARGDEFTIQGDDKKVQEVSLFLTQLSGVVEQGIVLSRDDIRVACNLFKSNSSIPLIEHFTNYRIRPSSKKFVMPRSENQRRYIEAIRDNDMVLGIGPAGTGKTYLAVAMAISYFNEKRVSRIILARPAVEAGEKLGFLPGDIAQKVDPYLRPLYDAIYDMVDRDKAERLLERGEIEIAPLAFMRGRTLNDSFAILDEAQNTTSDQMKMFLTRIGFNSKAVITGDITQIDLPLGKTSGLVESQYIIGSIPGIRFVYFNEQDVVRHPLVQKVIKAYERYENAKRRDNEKTAKKDV
ncbi:MAG: PhoH family protein [Acidobacteriota bacterium]